MEERRQKEKSKRKRCVNKSRVRDVILLALKTGKVEHSPKVGAMLWTEVMMSSQGIQGGAEMPLIKCMVWIEQHEESN